MLTFTQLRVVHDQNSFVTPHHCIFTSPPSSVSTIMNLTHFPSLDFLPASPCRGASRPRLMRNTGIRYLGEHQVVASSGQFSSPRRAEALGVVSRRQPFSRPHGRNATSLRLEECSKSGEITACAFIPRDRLAGWCACPPSEQAVSPET